MGQENDTKIMTDDENIKEIEIFLNENNENLWKLLIGRTNKLELANKNSIKYWIFHSTSESEWFIRAEAFIKGFLKYGIGWTAEWWTTDNIIYIYMKE